MTDGMDVDDVRRTSLDELVMRECAEWRLEFRDSPKRKERMRRAEEALRRCIEERAEPMLTDPELIMLALERQFDGGGGVASVAAPEVLIAVLVPFVEEAEWQGEDDEDRRVRMRLARHLAGVVVRLPECADADLSCGLRELAVALHHAERRLRRDQSARRIAQMSPKRRAQLDPVLASIDEQFGRRSDPSG